MNQVVLETNDHGKKVNQGSGPEKSNSRFGFHLPIATKLIISYLPIIIFSSGVFTIVGIQVIANRILSETQEKVRQDLNSGREIYLGKMNRISDVVRLTSSRFFLVDALKSNDLQRVKDELVKVKFNEHLDFLTLTDATGAVIFRADNPGATTSDKTYDELVASVLSSKRSVVASSIMTREELMKESPALAEQAFIKVIDTPRSRTNSETELTSGLIMKAAAPILDADNNLIGVLSGGVLINKNYDIVDDIKQTVFEGVQYRGKDIGTATIFLGDVRVSTNVKNSDGSRAIGTRISEEVYNQVFLKGEDWTGRAYVVNDWYFTAYEPIRDIHYQIIGILYVGILEQKYLDIRNQAILAFLSIALACVIISFLISFFIARRITGPINELVTASREIAHGNLNPDVKITSGDELGELASVFKIMAGNLSEREEKLKDFTTSKIMESERLALVGQLAANVAHELNNPLVGIVTYSQLLLEEAPSSDPSIEFLNKIVIQANRCKEIVRGLLDFSRQRKPDKSLVNVNNVIRQCISLLENQAIFHNIKINLTLNDLPMLIIDPSQIERVFMNIILNAAEAMEGHGTLDINSNLIPEESLVQIEFKDTGPGISEENLEKLFDPFFTTKEAGHGVGLGLAISYGIIREHNGTITVKSKPGSGTSFIIKLPVSVHGNMRYQ